MLRRRSSWMIFQMMRITMVLALVLHGFSDEQNGTEFRFNFLNLKHDHCRYPQVLDRNAWSCACPEILMKVRDECVCDGCLKETMETKYQEKSWEDLEHFVREEMEKSDDEEDSGFTSWNSSPPKDREETTELTLLSDPEEEKKMEPIMRRRSLVSPWAKPHSRFVSDRLSKGVGGKRLKVLKLREKPRYVSLISVGVARPGVGVIPYETPPRQQAVSLETLTGARPRGMVSPKTTFELPEVPLQKPDDGAAASDSALNMVVDTFSNSVVFGATSGSAASEQDKAFGKLSAPKGTGSLTMAADGGSGAASAYTGEGSSQIEIHSRGAEASGFTMHGPESRKATSTLVMLAGKGDAVATNTLSEKSSGSAAAVATKKRAGASSAAFGEAVAAAAASPGNGTVNTSSTFGEELAVGMKVTGGEDAIAGTIAVGDASDSLELALKAKNSEKQETESPSLFPEMKFDFFGSEGEGDLFD